VSSPLPDMPLPDMPLPDMPLPDVHRVFARKRSDRVGPLLFSKPENGEEFAVPQAHSPDPGKNIGGISSIPRITIK
jgi:hypothetical protein